MFFYDTYLWNKLRSYTGINKNPLCTSYKLIVNSSSSDAWNDTADNASDDTRPNEPIHPDKSCDRISSTTGRIVACLLVSIVAVLVSWVVGVEVSPAASKARGTVWSCVTCIQISVGATKHCAVAGKVNELVLERVGISVFHLINYNKSWNI